MITTLRMLVAKTLSLLGNRSLIRFQFDQSVRLAEMEKMVEAVLEANIKAMDNKRNF